MVLKDGCHDLFTDKIVSNLSVESEKLWRPFWNCLIVGNPLKQFSPRLKPQLESSPSQRNSERRHEFCRWQEIRSTCFARDDSVSRVFNTMLSNWSRLKVRNQTTRQCCEHIGKPLSSTSPCSSGLTFSTLRPFPIASCSFACASFLLVITLLLNSILAKFNF